MRAEVDEVCGEIRQTGMFHVHPVCWPDRAAFDSACALPVHGYVLVGSGTPCDELKALLATRPVDAPLIVLGEDAPPESSTCWLRQRPARRALGSLLEELVPTTRLVRDSEPPPSRAWRRKSDMIIGASAAVTQLLRMLDRLAPSSAPVLITGESGTGKDLVARALHYSGPRAAGPFIAVNCAAIPETLFEAELFGYQRGAFTGAVTARSGAFEAADNGTLFLDEIGEMPPSMQVKLLRVLETGEVTRLGSNESRKMDARVVAATNRNLQDEVKSGRFREDLFYRVSVYPVHIPPLRDRPEDIAPLVTHYLEEIGRREKRATPRLTHAGLEKLLSHQWPGNVRELVNSLERAVLLAELGAIDAPHVVVPTNSTPLITSYKEAKEEFEQQYFAQVMNAAGGNISLAAKLSSKTRKEVYDAMKRLGMNPDQYREQPESSGRIAAAGDAARRPR
ncbi:MAG TPA: sigma-54 dependent transcriptional regulator [Polyangiaceae bacterium]